ncbi:MAG: PIN domain-containing protein [Cytophagaceae bacterium]|nr:PIN domain-containing protein [Cytophagaceae bacterium]
MESEAILSIIDKCEVGIWDIFNGDVLTDEMNRTTDIVKKLKSLGLYSSATIYVELNAEIIKRARELQTYNIKAFDSLHLASAEYGKADVFLTTDKKLIKSAKRANAKVKVENPVIWLMEVLNNDW